MKICDHNKESDNAYTDHPAHPCSLIKIFRRIWDLYSMAVIGHRLIWNGGNSSCGIRCTVGQSWLDCKHRIKWLEKKKFVWENLKFCWKNFSLWSHWKFGGTWHIVLPSMILYRRRHSRFVTIATTELSNVVLITVAEWRSDDANMTSMWRHRCYDDRSMTSFV